MVPVGKRPSSEVLDEEDEGGRSRARSGARSGSMVTVAASPMDVPQLLQKRLAAGTSAEQMGQRVI